MIDKARETALKILYKIDKEKAYSNIALAEQIKQNRKILNDKDIGLISEIVYGTITWKLTIDEIIKKYSNIKIKKISFWILNILRMGVYQIVFLDKIPKSAAVNESVNLAKRYGHKSSAGFVNAILRNVDKNDYEDMFLIKNDIERISKTNSMPEWIVKELLKELQLKDVENICKNSNIKPKITIRVNNLKTNKKELIENLKKENINFEEGILEDFLVLEKAKDIENMELFKKGFFTIQDEAAGLSAKLLNVLPNDVVLDACSAPGGKTTYLAEMMKNKGEIIAWDIHEHRTKLVQDSARRLGILIIKTQVEDASIFKPEYIEKFDKILLDVPCLGIGVLKRKPDIKWRRSFEDIHEITELQKRILENCSKYLKKGGVLVYSTCSILKQENMDVIKCFLNNNHDYFEINQINLKGFFEKYCENNSYIQVYQNPKSDGFFICKLTKK